jgi:hypothetical protein
MHVVLSPHGQTSIEGDGFGGGACTPLIRGPGRAPSTTLGPTGWHTGMHSYRSDFDGTENDDSKYDR